MAQYVVLRDCFALNRLWLKGEEVELAGVRVPCHFQEIKGAEARIAGRVAGLMVAPDDGNTADDQSADVAPDDGKAAAEESTEEPKALEKTDVFTLRKLARDAGIEIEKGAKKTEIIAALRGE